LNKQEISRSVLEAECHDDARLFETSVTNAGADQLDDHEYAGMKMCLHCKTNDAGILKKSDQVSP